MRSLSCIVPSASPHFGTKHQMNSFNCLNNDLGSKVFPSLPQIFISSEINTTMCLLPTAGKLWSDWNDIIVFSYGISVLWDFREKLCGGLRWSERTLWWSGQTKRWNCLKEALLWNKCLYKNWKGSLKTDQIGCSLAHSHSLIPAFNNPSHSSVQYEVSQDLIWFFPLVSLLH